MQNKSIKVECPTCSTEVIWSKNSEYRPFCSKRCKLIDLGQWADERYKIETNQKPESGPGEELSSYDKH